MARLSRAGGHEAARIRLRREGRAASNSLRTASAQPGGSVGSVVPASEARSDDSERRDPERKQTPRGPEKSANDWQRSFLDPDNRRIMSERSALDPQISRITSEMIPRHWQKTVVHWQYRGVDSG